MSKDLKPRTFLSDIWWFSARLFNTLWTYFVTEWYKDTKTQKVTKIQRCGDKKIQIYKDMKIQRYKRNERVQTASLVTILVSHEWNGKECNGDKIQKRCYGKKCNGI